MRFFHFIGAGTLNFLNRITSLLAVVFTLLRLAAKRRSWTSVVRSVFARQILFTGVEAIKFLGLIAIMAGISIVVQANMWLSNAGQTDLLGPILVTVIIREIAPLFTNLIVIARSGTAVSAELANMRVNKEIELLELQGIDPLLYLVMPRVLGISISVFCLTIFFILFSLASGYIFGLLIPEFNLDFDHFTRQILNALKTGDLFNLFSKSLLISFLTSLICCMQGLGIRGYITEVPQACTKAMEKSMGILFVFSALISVLTYYL